MTDSAPPDSAPPPAPPSFEPQMPLPGREENPFRSSSLVFGILRVCLYVLLANVIGYVVQRLSSVFAGHEVSPVSPRRLVAVELASFAGAFAAAWVMSRLEKRTFADYGLPLRGAFGKLFWLGALFGLAEISAVVGAMGALGCYHFGWIVLSNATQLLHWLIFWAVFFLVVGFYEEFAFRGYVQFTLSQGLGFWPAALLLSVAFGIVHIFNPGENWVGIMGIVLTGIFWCFTLRRTGSLWFAIGMHASFDFGETFLYSVPDSGVIFPGHLSNATLAGPAWITGGTAGPEGSVFDFALLLLFFYAVHKLLPGRSATGSGPDVLLQESPEDSSGA
jgi:membrane protease YdiL (CAAX protease family)